MPKVFVVVEHDGRTVDDASYELATVARTLAGDGGSVVAMLAGDNPTRLIDSIKTWFDEVVVLNDDRLHAPDGDLLLQALIPIVDREAPQVVLAAHTNNTMDFVPGLAVRLDRPLLTDCLSLGLEGGELSGVRPAYGGKVHVRVRAVECERGYVATIRPGAVKAGQNPGRSAVVREVSVADTVVQRRRYVKTMTSDAGDVDISQAERLVAVGRGIEDEESLEIIRRLAEALGAEVACSRPVVDKQWMPKSRQVGTSGKSVKPKLYVAVGISGSFQHMGGIKGDPFLVAINRDPRAPIFAAADVGIVGDLFEIVPALEAKIRAMN